MDTGQWSPLSKLLSRRMPTQVRPLAQVQMADRRLLQHLDSHSLTIMPTPLSGEGALSVTWGAHRHQETRIWGESKAGTGLADLRQ